MSCTARQSIHGRMHDWLNVTHLENATGRTLMLILKYRILKKATEALRASHRVSVAFLLLRQKRKPVGMLMSETENLKAPRNCHGSFGSFDATRCVTFEQRVSL